MGLTYCISWTVSADMLVRFAAVLIVGVLFGSFSRGAELRGVLRSLQQGQGKNSSGQAVLEIDGALRQFEYVPRSLKFLNASCHEIGAIWTVRIGTPAHDNKYISGVACDGLVDPSIHEPWLLVRDYFRSLAKPKVGARRSFFSSSWKSSPNYRAYESRLNSLDLRSYVMFGREGTCLEALRAPVAGSTSISTMLCHLDRNSSTTITFEVRKNPTAASWEIDRVTFESPVEYWKLKSRIELR